MTVRALDTFNTILITTEDKQKFKTKSQQKISKLKQREKDRQNRTE